MSPARTAANPWMTECRQLLLMIMALTALLLLAAPVPGQSAAPLVSPPVVALPDAAGHQPLMVYPPAAWRPPVRVQCPLPPASAVAFDTGLRKYLETWPTPGATATGDWPEYVPEAGAYSE